MDKNQEREQRISENLRMWAERVAIRGSFENQKIKAYDMLHDVYGILRDDEHFLPRL